MGLHGYAGIAGFYIGNQRLSGGKLGGGHSRIFLVVALKADADGIVVGPLGLGAYGVLRPAAPDRTVLADVVVVSDTDPAVVQMPPVNVLYRGLFRLGMMKNQIGCPGPL